MQHHIQHDPKPCRRLAMDDINLHERCAQGKAMCARLEALARKISREELHYAEAAELLCNEATRIEREIGEHV